MYSNKLFGLVFAAAFAGSATSLQATLVHRYSFTNDVSDSVGGGSFAGTSVGSGIFTNGQADFTSNLGQGSNAISTDGYIDLPNGIITSTASISKQLSVEMWVTPTTNRDWAEIYSFGTSDSGENASNGGSGSPYLAGIPQNGANHLMRISSHTSGGEPVVDDVAALATGVQHHVVAVYDQSGGLPGTETLYVDGALIGSNSMATGLDLSNYTNDNNWLGRSQWPDPVFQGSFNELRLYDSALTGPQVAADFIAGPDVVPEPSILGLGSIAAAVIGLRRRRRLGIQLSTMAAKRAIFEVQVGAWIAGKRAE